MDINHTDMDSLIGMAMGIACREFARRRDRALSELQRDNFFAEMKSGYIDYAQFCERYRALYEQAYDAWTEHEKSIDRKP